jgi:hypothetical protein
MAEQIRFVTLANRAHQLLRSLGARVAAGYLRNRNVSLEDALVLLGMPVRKFG